MKRHIGPETPIGVAVVRAVSAVENCEPTSLPLLSDVVDPEALDKVCRSDGDPVVAFEFSNSHVTVEAGDAITVLPRTELSGRS